MRIRKHIACFVMVLVAATQAHASGDTIVLSCPVEHAPSVQDVSALPGTTTLQATFKARDNVVHLARAACRRGALTVSVIAGPQPPNSLVQRDVLDIARGLPVR